MLCNIEKSHARCKTYGNLNVDVQRVGCMLNLSLKKFTEYYVVQYNLPYGSKNRCSKLKYQFMIPQVSVYLVDPYKNSLKVEALSSWSWRKTRGKECSQKIWKLFSKWKILKIIALERKHWYNTRCLHQIRHLLFTCFILALGYSHK